MSDTGKSDANGDSASGATTSAAPVGDGGAAAENFQPPPHPSPYEEGETVIASHGKQFYKAKVEKVDFHEDWSYLIHYPSWKKSSRWSSISDQRANEMLSLPSQGWDEWVGIDRLMRYTEENSQKLSHDRKHFTDKYAKSGQISHTKLDTYFENQMNNSSLIHRTRKRDHFVVKGKDAAAVEKINISIPPTLKKQLMDDFEYINKMGKLVKLPRTPNVDEILEKYYDCKQKKDVVITASVREVLSGLRYYFNEALPVLLLYSKERQQCQEAILDSVSPSGVYGAEHFLRLFVKLPALFNDLSIKEKTLRELQQNLQEILKFLHKNQSVFFLSTYHLPEASGRTTSKDG